ncbi:MAG: hypothetical protein JO287_20535 [Pseudonocardiales bacterium]|nr:hypothetical protein [Pseudonocardiales bacterium]
MVAGVGGLRVECRGVTEQISGLVRWVHRLGEQAHCLARLVLVAPGAPVVAVLSEIASNPDELGITGDFAVAADAFVQALIGAGRRVDPAHVVWMAHHGPFSSYDPAGPETFTEVALVYDGQRYHDELSRHRLLTRVEASQRVTPWGLKPVEQVLADLGQLG